MSADLWTASVVTYPVGTVVFDTTPVTGGYFQNLANAWTATTVATPAIGEVLFDSVAAGYFQNIASVWTAVPGTNPLGSVVQVAGAVYENLGNVWAPSVITPYSEGTLVFNEADNLNYQVTAGAWALQTVIDRASYVYPNGQEAAPVWFHDHMLGATRLNVYAGIAGGYVITEPASTLAPGLHPLGLSDAAHRDALTTLTGPPDHPGPHVRHHRPALLPERRHQPRAPLLGPGVRRRRDRGERQGLAVPERAAEALQASSS